MLSTLQKKYLHLGTDFLPIVVMLLPHDQLYEQVMANHLDLVLKLREKKIYVMGPTCFCFSWETLHLLIVGSNHSVQTTSARGADESNKVIEQEVQMLKHKWQLLHRDQETYIKQAMGSNLQLRRKLELLQQSMEREKELQSIHGTQEKNDNEQGVGLET